MRKKRRRRSNLDPNELHTCAICFEEKKTSDLCVLDTCNHRYCQSCIENWFEKENSCPQCKQNVRYLDIPKRKHRKRIHSRSLGDDSEDDAVEDSMARLIQFALTNYVRSHSFRSWISLNVLQDNDQAQIMWSVIQHTLPLLNESVVNMIVADSTNMSELSYSVLEAHDAMTRLVRAQTRTSRL